MNLCAQPPTWNANYRCIDLAILNMGWCTNIRSRWVPTKNKLYASLGPQEEITPYVMCLWIVLLIYHRLLAVEDHKGLRESSLGFMSMVTSLF